MPTTVSHDAVQSRASMTPAVWLIAAGMVVLLLAVANRYGFHRDEMYFILAGRHPDLGYVDQPPITPLLSAAAVGLLGLSPLAIRILPALAVGATVVLAAGMTARFGGSRTAQCLAALVVAVSGVLGAGHLDETTTPSARCCSHAHRTAVAAPISSRAVVPARRRMTTAHNVVESHARARVDRLEGGTTG